MKYYYEALHALVQTRKYEITYVAKKVGRSTDTIYRWMAGHGEPRASELAALCELFKVQVKYFYEAPYFTPLKTS